MSMLSSQSSLIWHSNSFALSMSLSLCLPLWRYKILHQYRSDGKIKSVGVSNFNVHHLEILHKSCPSLPLPVCNQIECTPFLQDTVLIEYCAERGILIQSYSPLAQSKYVVSSNETLHEIATKYSKSWSQIMLRWQVQKGYILLPKSVTPHRIISNGQIFDFKLSDSEMEQLDTLKIHQLRVCFNGNPLDEPWDDTYSLSASPQAMVRAPKCNLKTSYCF